MARRPRNYIKGYCYHLVQRGVNRAMTFFDPSDFSLYLAMWREYADFYGLDVHAYCLMTNHVHFLATPLANDSISQVTRAVGSAYAGIINKKYDRTGTLWEGRHRSSLVYSERYVIACYRYIELNPVRAHMVDHPSQYRWSSYVFNSGARSGWLTPHPAFLSLADCDSNRNRIYRELVTQPLGDEMRDRIRKALDTCMPLATEGEIRSIETTHGVSFGFRKRGRPQGRRDSVDQK